MHSGRVRVWFTLLGGHSTAHSISFELFHALQTGNLTVWFLDFLVESHTLLYCDTNLYITDSLFELSKAPTSLAAFQCNGHSFRPEWDGFRKVSVLSLLYNGSLLAALGLALFWENLVEFVHFCISILHFRAVGRILVASSSTHPPLESAWSP